MSIRIQDPTWNADNIGALIRQCVEAAIPVELHPKLYWTAAKDGDHGPRSWHYANLYYQGSRGAALDLASPMNEQGQRAMQAASRALIRYARFYVELIHSTPFSDDNGFYVNDGRLVPGSFYNEPGAHLSHIHVAMTEAQCHAMLAALGQSPGTGGGLPPFSLKWPLPAGHYFGLISGPAESHGGYTPDEKVWVREIQKQLIRKGYVPGVTDPASGWADGVFEQPTADAVARFQRAEMPGTKYYGQVWSDDFAKLFETTSTSGIHVFGWDASDFDYARGMRTGHVRAAYAEGIRFLTHKVSEWGAGNKTIHQHCGEMLSAARDVGMLWFGAYVVARSGRDIKAQAQCAIEALNAQTPGLIEHPRFRWQVDTEKWRDRNGVVYDAVDPGIGAGLLAELNSRTGKPMGFHYAPRWAYGDSIPGDDPLWASDYSGSGDPAHWRAEWERTRQDDHPGWARYSRRVPAILQYSSDSIIGGQHPCDANVFRGNEADMLRLTQAR